MKNLNDSSENSGSAKKSITKDSSVFWAKIGERFHPKGSVVYAPPGTRNNCLAAGGSSNDQKKFVRSSVVAHNDLAAFSEINLKMSFNFGNWNVGIGSGENVFIKRRSAMRDTFSVVFGMTKSVQFGVDPLGSRKDSVISVFIMRDTCGFTGLCASAKLAFCICWICLCVTIEFQICNGMGRCPRTPNPF